MTLQQYLKKGDLRAFAKSIGKSRQIVYDYLDGKCQPTLRTAFLIEEVTGGKVDVYSWKAQKPAGRHQ